MLIKLAKENKITAVACFSVLVLSVILEWYGRYCGFILTNDSLQYLSAAKSFSESKTFLSPDGSYYSYWPPLFPIILSWWDDTFFALGVINLISKVCIAIVLFWLSITFFERTFYRILFLSASMLSVYLTLISVFVWTELLFLALLLMNAYFALNYNKQRFFYGLLLTGFLLCIQRNAGLFWISGVCVWMMVEHESTFSKNMVRAILFFIISTSGLWAWNFYNTFFLPTNFNFYKHSFFQDWMYNISLIANTYTNMILPSTNNIIVSVVVGFAFGLVVYSLRFNSNRKLHLVIITLLMYTLGYSVMVKLDVHEMDRYFSVITPMFFLLLIVCTEKLLQGVSSKLQLACMVLMVCWLVYPITRTLKNVQFWHERSCLIESVR